MFHSQGCDEGFDKGGAVGNAKCEARGEERGLVRQILGLVKKGVVGLWKALVWIVREWADWFLP